LIQELGRKGAERLKAHFTMEQMAQSNEAYYYALLEKSDLSHVNDGEARRSS
jgi:hypothetical protein